MNISQQWKQPELNLQDLVEESVSDYSSEILIASCLSESPAGEIRLLESILEPGNMKRALKRVIRNKGAPGVDGMTVYQLKGYLSAIGQRSSKPCWMVRTSRVLFGEKRLRRRKVESVFSEFPTSLIA